MNAVPVRVRADGGDGWGVRRWTLIVVVSVAALVLRLAILDRTNADLTDHFIPWLEDIRANGFLVAISRPFSAFGYTPFYSYCLGIADALLPVGTDPHVVIKSVSVLFDYLAAALVGAITWEYRRNRNLAVIGYAAVLFAPTVVLNGSIWGQSDIIYTTFLLAALLNLLKHSPLRAMMWFGVAVSVKLQAAWLGPFILLMVLRGKIRWWMLALIPAAYVVIAAPALLAGRSLIEVTTIYLTQARTQHALDHGAANLQFFLHYFLVHKGMAPASVPVIAKVSIVFAVALSLLFAWVVSRRPLREEGFFLAALISVLLPPLLLPHMHDRYFFAADILAILVALQRPGWWPAALVMQFSSIATYVTFLVPGMEKLPVSSLLAALGFSNNLQPFTGLIALGSLLNAALLAVAWRRLRGEQQACRMPA